MKPLQIWLPMFGRGIGFGNSGRDMRRAFDFWDCDHRIWLLPDLDDPIRWQENWNGEPARIAAIPAEVLDYVDIYHVGERGYLCGPPGGNRFPGVTVDSLLDAWLSWPARGGISFHAPHKLTVDVPRRKGEKVQYERRQFMAPILPIDPHRSGNELTLKFPKHRPSLIFAEAELQELLERRYGPLKIQYADDALPTLVSVRNPEAKLSAATLMARPPLTDLFPAGIGLDAINSWYEMQPIIKAARKDPAAALQQARGLAAPYLSTGRSTRGFIWYLPTMHEVDDIKTLIERGATLGLNDARTFDEVRKSKAWRQAMTEYIDVQRVWGPVGVFWALLIERLESGGALMHCQRCGRPLTGHRLKQSCSKADNPECYAQRRAADRQRERLRKTQPDSNSSSST